MSYTKLIPPSTGTIKAMIAADLSLKECVTELVANSLDQDPTEIELRLDKAKAIFSISDNGKGCSDLEKMVEIGTHIPNDKHSIGRHGVGFKDAATWLGENSIVDSMTRKGKKQSAFADWQNMIALGSWSVQFDHDSDRKTPGLTVKISGLYPRRFRAWKEVPGYISEGFSAAIDAGVKISVDGKEVRSNPEPLLDKKIFFQGAWAGLKFQGFAGILADRKAAKSGWEIRYLTQSIHYGYMREGFGNYSPMGFYGRFQMLDSEERKWKLNRNKTDSEDLADVLHCPDIQQVIIPLLEELKKQNQSIAISLNQLKTQTFLTQLLQKAQVRILEDEKESGSEKKKPESEKPESEKPAGDLEKKKREHTRRKRVYDPLSDTKAKIKMAQSFNIERHQDPKHYGLSFVERSEGGKIFTVYIDESTLAGKRILESPVLLPHQAIVALAAWFGDRPDIMKQLQLPLGDCGDCGETKFSKCLMYLLSHADPDQLGEGTLAA
jgi:hypothetical protein